MGIVSFLLSNKNLVIGAILLALIAGTSIYIKILRSEVTSSKAEVTILKSDLQVSQASIKTLQQAIVDQNSAIDKLKTAGDVRVAAHQVELAKAKATADSYKKQAQEIMISKVPDNIPKCDASNDLINQEIKNAR